MTERLALSIPEAAAVLGVHKNTVAALVERGELRSLRIGRRRLISVWALREFIQGREGF